MYFAFVVLCAYQVTELYYYRLQEHELDAKQLALVAVRTYFMNSHERSVFNISRIQCGIFLGFRYHTILLFVHIYVFNNHRWTS
jgi:hypothetical protein